MSQLEEEEAVLMKEIIQEHGNLTGNMLEDMEIREKIHKLEMEMKGVKPLNSFNDPNIECIGCGS